MTLSAWSKELKCWALRSGESATPYVGSEELQFQNPLLRWHDAPYFPCVGSWWATSLFAARDVWLWWPRDRMTWLMMSGKLWKKCWWGWPVMTLFEVTGAYLEKSWALRLATSMVLERHGDILENACWLCPTNNAQHINLAELDATVKGVLLWQTRTVHLHTDSVCIYHWLTDGKSPNKHQSCKWDAGSKEVDNPTAADPWIRPPSQCYFCCVEAEFGRWANSSTKEMATFDKAQVRFLTPDVPCSDRSINTWTNSSHTSTMWTSWHQMTYFCHRICLSTTKAIVRSIIQTSEECQSIDPVGKGKNWSCRQLVWT